jgi:hypothetical protein
MFVERREDVVWSALALRGVKISLALSIILSALDGVVRVMVKSDPWTPQLIQMAVFWISDFRYLSEQVLLVAAILFVGAKFFETRTVLMLGFDRDDASKITLKGPDDENIVWIGRRYDSVLEAEAAAAAAARKLESQTRAPS